MKTRTVTLKEANEYVSLHHRHHKPVTGHKFSFGCEHEGRLVGVAIVGRPVSRYLDDGQTLEVNRCCTDGTPNACSFLYAHAWRIAKEMGYTKIITYILESESGTSLKAAGWTDEGRAGKPSWTGKRKQVDQKYPAEFKHRYSMSTGGMKC